MIAHRGTSAGRSTVGAGNARHQARTRPVREPIEGRCIRIGALFAVAGYQCIDQPRIDATKVAPRQLEFCEQRKLEVGDENVGVGDQLEERVAPGRLGQIEYDASLVTTGQKPGVVEIRTWITRN